MLLGFCGLRETRCSENAYFSHKENYTHACVVKPYGILQVKNAFVKKNSLAGTVMYKGYSARWTAYLSCTEAEMSDC
jgi:hypothetical protein